MKTLIAMLMVLGLVGFAVAQDLDAPTMGTAVEQSNNDGGGAGSTAYDIIIAKMQEAEAAYIARSIIEAEWMVWGRDYWGWSTQTMQNFANGNAAWNQAAADSEAMWSQLSPAEAAAAVNQMSSSHQRVLAAGLN